MRMDFKVKNLLDDDWVYINKKNFYKNLNIIKGSTLCEYSGYLDSLGKKIYEGDIIKYFYYTLTKQKKWNYMYVIKNNNKFIAINIKTNTRIDLKTLIYENDVFIKSNIYN